MSAETAPSRDGQILAHIRRFGLTTPKVLHRLFFAEVSLKAVERVTTRLLRDEKIVSYPLYHPHCYYRLSPSTARLFRLTEEDTQPYGAQAILRAYGTLAFCCLRKRLRQKLTTQEFEKRFPGCVAPTLRSHGYYIDEDGKTMRLGLILVDHGADYRRMIRKCQRELRRRLALREFQNIYKRKQFVIAIVTGSKEKAARFEEMLPGISGTLCYRVEIVPELAHMTGRHA